MAPSKMTLVWMEPRPSLKWDLVRITARLVADEACKDVVQRSGFVTSASAHDNAVTLGRGVIGVQSIKGDVVVR